MSILSDRGFIFEEQCRKKIDKVYYNRIKVGYLLTNMWHLLPDHPVSLLIKTNKQEKLQLITHLQGISLASTNYFLCTLPLNYVYIYFGICLTIIEIIKENHFAIHQSL